MSISIDVKDAAKVLQKFDNEAKRRIKRAGVRGAERGRAILVRRTPTDTGQARGAWRVIDFPFSPAGDQSLARIFNDAPHIGIIEAGARPHPVSAAGWAAIYAWVLRHFHDQLRDEARTGQASSRAAGRGRGAKIGVRVDRGAAYITNAIVNKIRTEGQKPTYFIKNSLDDLRRAMVSEVKREMRELARNPPRRP